MGKRGVIALLCLVLVLTSSCAKEKRAQTFTGNGLTITLTEAFALLENDTFTVAYQSDTILVAANREERSVFDGYAESLDDYGQLVLLANDLSCEIVKENGLTYFVYENSVDGKAFRYLASLYESDAAFWMINFICEESSFEKLKGTMLGYAASVQVV